MKLFGMNPHANNMNPSSLNGICQEGLRIDFFRLHPDTPEIKYEEGLIKGLNERINCPVASYKALGHYDVICLYPFNDIDNIIFKGSIEGIRSFSNINCICKIAEQPKILIDKLLSSDFIAIFAVALNYETLSNHGGIQNDIIESLSAKYNGIYLNSSSWGEHIIIISADSMESLLVNYKKISADIEHYSIDIHYIIGINYNLILQIDKGVTYWDEIILPTHKLIWMVELLPSKSNDFNKLLAKIAPSFVDLKSVFNSSSSSKFLYEVISPKWIDVIKSIRDVRREAYDILISTKLNILTRQ